MQKTTELTAIDIAMLLKLIANQDNPLMQTQLSEQLYIAQSEVSRSLSRLDYAQLYSKHNKSVSRMNTFEFLVYGVKYAFPVQPGSIVRGIVTNASAESFNAKVKAFRSQFRGVRNTEYFLYRLIKLCMAYAKGNLRGQKKADQILDLPQNKKALRSLVRLVFTSVVPPEP
ncbi:transposase [Leeuwenhoekiella marinoflava]|uniref:Transposase n=2 Tax=Leeuwenhoekiella marinoflava TaxID=988 RepID=A0A4Q0PQZ8_9FLAO|nr:transposase [Leeuwenhoekiella marinoflava]SHE35414.1 Transposase [Leeuwenhoekiella marinoflava DSM 3653]